MRTPTAGRGTRAVVILLAALAGLVLPLAAESPRPHLPFFHDNRAFVLQAWENARIDDITVESQARDWDFDPFAAWSAEDAVAHARAAWDSAATPADLAAFHAGVDSLLQAMQEAGSRLDDLDFRFAAHVRTGLELTLATPPAVDVVRIEADVEGRSAWQHELSGAERAALRQGGILEILRRPMEPRTHRIEVRTWVRGATSPSVTQVDVSPIPNELVRVHLVLERAEAPATQEHTRVTEGS